MDYSVFLRPFLISDTETINQWRNNEAIQQWTAGRFRKVSIEIERNWVQSKMTNNEKEEYFAICLNDSSKEMIGYFSIREIDIYNRKCFFGGIVIDPEYQEGVYMIDTHLIAFDYAFIHLGMNRIAGTCLEEHPVSRIMMEMLGFKLEGIEQNSVYKNHKYHNLCNYALLYEDYKHYMKDNYYSKKNILKRLMQLKKVYKTLSTISK
ncbi:MAG: GNAT family N-acetyltransferase [Muribaculaceae bacterium]|nr:GNAT family N-acetyltransferase [Muribaculaceae bacterium]